MYFSKNSRYVLQGGQFLSPSSYLFKNSRIADRNLSVKSPKDDPTKPALRLNIPKDTPKPDHLSGIQDSANFHPKDIRRSSRSKSVSSKIDDNKFQYKGEGDSLLLKFNNGSILSNENVSGGSNLRSPTYKPVESKKDKKVKTTTYEESTDPFANPVDCSEYLIENESTGNTEKSPGKPEGSEVCDDKDNAIKKEKTFEKPCSEEKDSEEKNSMEIAMQYDSKYKAYEKYMTQGDNTSEAITYKTSDPVRETEEKTASYAESLYEGKNYSPSAYKQDTTAEAQYAETLPSHKSAVDIEQNKSLEISAQERDRNSYNVRQRMGRTEPKPKFEVHEIEDVGSYVPQLKAINNFKAGIACVPEKEFYTRSRDWSVDSEPIRMRKPANNKTPKISTYFSEESSEYYSLPTSKNKKQMSKSEITEDDQRNKNSQMNSMRNFHNSSAQWKPMNDSTEETGFREITQIEGIGMPLPENESLVHEKSWSHSEMMGADQEMKSSLGSNDLTISKNYSTTTTIPSTSSPPLPPLPSTATTTNDNITINTTTTPNEGVVDSKSSKEEKASDKVESLQQFGTIVTTADGKTEGNKNVISENKANEPKLPAGDKGIESNRKSAAERKIENFGENAFKAAESMIKITTENSRYPSKYSPAFPPILSTALTNRGKMLRNKQSFFRPSKRAHILDDSTTELKSPREKKIPDLSENSILFPDRESKKFDCESLFNKKIDVVKTESEINEDVTEKMDNNSVDTLTMMRTVKKIVDFDLKNAIKLFDVKDVDRKVPSVMVLKGEEWKVDEEKLEECIENQKKEMENLLLSNTNFIVGTKIEKPEITFDCENNAFERFDETLTPKYCPSKEADMMGKLASENNSIVLCNPENLKFVVNEKELDSVIFQRAEEISREPEIDLSGFSNSGIDSRVSVDFKSPYYDEAKEAKGGDSILVYDDVNKTWIVDYSILEKREERRKEEEELIKKSEFILETFERLERENASTIPRPDSPAKRTFDYNKNEWKEIEPEKKAADRSGNFSPMKADAEEIRQKNSDLFNDLFVSRKTSKISTEKEYALGLDLPAKSKSCSLRMSEYENSGTASGSNEVPVAKNAEASHNSGGEGTCQDKEEDNFWESFLKMNILPKYNPKVGDLEKIPPIPSPTPKPLSPPVQKIDEPEIKIPLPPLPTPQKKIEDPKSKTPPPTAPNKVEDPAFRIQIPLIGDIKIPDPWGKRVPPPSKKKDNAKEEPSSSKKGQKPEAPVTKAPPSSAQTEIKEDPKVNPEKMNDPKIGVPEEGPPKNAASLPMNESFKIKEPDQNEPLHTTGPYPRADFKTNPTMLSLKEEKGPSDHYISEKIVEISRNSLKDNTSKVKSSKVETVKINITPDTRLPSKITEINLNKKCEEKDSCLEKKPNKDDSKEPSNMTSTKNEKYKVENKTFYKNFEKYKTPFSDPEYEEKSMKIKSDTKSNPNLKKLDSSNKTLVLHDVMKPTENIESWLKDETDKMASLLLKVLQEAAEDKPRKKPNLKSKSLEKIGAKGNPYDTIRKKQETTPEKFLLKVRSVNSGLENEKNMRSSDFGAKAKNEKSKPITVKEIPIQSAKTVKPPKVIDLKSPASLGKDLFCSKNVARFTEPQALLRGSKAKEKLTEKIGDIFATDLSPAEYTSLNRHTEPDVTEDIPGPEFLKKISRVWKLFPAIGCQSIIFVLTKLIQMVKLGGLFSAGSTSNALKSEPVNKLITKYGPIVSLNGPFSGNVVLIHKPEHVEAVFEQDSSFTVRSVFDSLDCCRRDAEEKLLPVGMSVDWSKPEWDGLKKASSDPLFKGSDLLFKSVDVAGDSLISNIRRNKNGQNFASDDFMEEIKKWSVEGLCSVLFEKSFGFLEGRNNQASWLLEPDKLYVALEEASRHLSKCEKGFQMWRCVSTPSFSGLSESYRNLSNLLSKQLYQAEVNLKNKNDLLKDSLGLEPPSLNFVESMILNDGMTSEEVLCNIIDILLIGMNTMSSAVGFLLYNLSQNIKSQHKVLKEVKEVLPKKNSRLGYHKLHTLQYLHACLKESLRLNIPVPVLFRVTQNDILLSNYVLPKGTYLVMDSKVSCFKEQTFNDPDRFVPERWLTDEKWLYNVNSFSSLPFCHGPRAELAKQMVEMQICSCVAKIIRNFKVEYQFGEIQGTNDFVSLPNKPLKLSFVDRED